MVYILVMVFGINRQLTEGRVLMQLLKRVSHQSCTHQTVQFTNDRTSLRCSMINFKDRVWPSDYKNQGGPVSTVSLVYKVYGYAALVVSMRHFPG